MKEMTKKEKNKLCLPSAQPVNKIEILLWAMEHADSPNPWVRRRWWAFRSRVEHPLDQEATIHEVPLQIVQPPTESPESLKCKRRRTVVATSLARRSRRFPCCFPCLNGGGIVV
ncbi:hypothetical protein ZWY2020_037714 [Hordeum vulgare]|nr:hypothetical protein ZWY2020_027924 [Hordeum vulgare]KAI5013670.1 hypothetical protein ZWY2020_037714 [Hordeum vulgare]